MNKLKQLLKKSGGNTEADSERKQDQETGSETPAVVKKSPAARKRQSRITTLIIVIIFAIGVGIMAYPTVADKYNTWLTRNVISSYDTAVQNMSEDQYKDIKDAATAYNQDIAENGLKWVMTDADMEEYNRQLAIGEPVSGVNSTPMGYVEIPKINQRLTIYHTCDEQVLQRGIGHMEGTSLPVGGKGTHCAMSGHRGLPSAKLFTDLDKLVAGDIFQITVLDETITYEVDQILVTDPDDLAPLAIEEGQDLCTLITCTPYAVNTHRLLVRGHRIRNPVEATGDADPVNSEMVAPFLMVGIIAVIFVIALAVAGRKRYRRKHGKGEEAAERAADKTETDAVENNLPKDDASIADEAAGASEADVSTPDNGAGEEIE